MTEFDDELEKINKQKQTEKNMKIFKLKILKDFEDGELKFKTGQIIDVSAKHHTVYTEMGVAELIKQEKTNEETKKEQLMEISKDEAIQLNKELPKDKTTKDILQEKLIKNREELYENLKKWIYLPDTNRIDLILAVYISTFDVGKPLWVFIVGGSGDCKSELINTLDGRYGVRKIDQLTANTLASGRMKFKKNTETDEKYEVNVKDLGFELQGKKTLLMFTDLACLTSLNKDEKKKIWSQFRTLYDGEIFKDTGSGAKRKYIDCHVNIIAGVTSAIKDEYSVHQQLGTRELLYDTDPDPRDNNKKMTYALKHTGKEALMKKELKETIDNFLLDKKYNPFIEVTDDILNYIFFECEELRILRATGSTDWKTGEANTDYEAEVTTRLVQQLVKLYRSLHSLDPQYPDKNFKEIVKRIVKSSSDPVRYKLYYFFQKYPDDYFTTYDLHLKHKNSRISIQSQCEALWNMGILEKIMTDELIGGRCITDEYGHEKIIGGRWDRIAKYKWNGNKLTQVELRGYENQ